MVSKSPLKISEMEMETPLIASNNTTLLDHADKDCPTEGNQSINSPKIGEEQDSKFASRPKVRKKSRRSQCGDCAGCRREDCGICSFCKGMIKFGGSGKIKKKCKHRKCENMSNIISDTSVIETMIGKYFTGIKKTSVTSSNPSSPSDTPPYVTLSTTPPCVTLSTTPPCVALSTTPSSTDLSTAPPSTGLSTTPTSTDLSTTPTSTDLSTMPPCITLFDTPTTINLSGTPPTINLLDTPPSNLESSNRLLKRSLSEGCVNEENVKRCRIDTNQDITRVLNSAIEIPIGPATPPLPVTMTTNDIVTIEKLVNKSCDNNNNKKLSTCSRQFLKSTRSACSPKKHPSSPRRYPSPAKKRPSSPRRYPSPAKKSSVHRLSGKNSPRKTAAILFSTIKKEELCPSFDHAPFNGLIHVNRGVIPKDDPLIMISRLGLKPVPGGDPEPNVGTSLNLSPDVDRLLTTPTRNKVKCEDKKVLTHKKILAQLKTDHRDDDVDGIMNRYRIIKTQIDNIAASQQHLQPAREKIHPLFVRKRQQKQTVAITKRRNNNDLSLCCSINITRDSKGLIIVDTNRYSSYDNKDGNVPSALPSNQKDGVTLHSNQNGKITRSRRTAFKIAQERLSYEYPVINKENKKPSQDVTIVATPTPQTESPALLTETSPLEEIKSPSCRFGLHLWNDLYHPKKSCDIIGNKEGVAKVYNWLSKWKSPNSKDLETEINATRINPASRGDPDYMAPLVRRRARAVNMNDSLNSSFASNEDGDMVDVALLLCGPVGCGKTAAVYTCAHELGYKVLEINSTLLRNRQNVLSILREATQSHHVSVQQAPPTVAKATSVARPKKGLMAFFKPKPKPVSNPTVSGCGKQVTIETNTLILLEEVDLINEDEDKGFWSAIFDIVQSSKRPLIFTANDPEMQLSFQHLKILFQPPPFEVMSLHCQLLSLSHDVHMTCNVANQITSCANNDVRKLFNILHFYLATHKKSSSEEGEGEEVCPSKGVCPSAIDWASSLPSFLNKVSLDDLPVVDMRKVIDPLSLKNSSCDISVLADSINILRDTDCRLSEHIVPFIINRRPVNRATPPPDEPHIATPITDEICRATPLISEVYRQLDQLINVCDGLSDCDIITKSHDCYKMSHDIHAPWWKSHVTTSLVDELPCNSSQLSFETKQFRNCVEACLLLISTQESVHNRMKAQESVHNRMKAQESVCNKSPDKKDVHEAHDCHMTSCDVFSVRTELERCSLMTECLPYLHIICKNEKERETNGTKRRFSHYLDSCDVPIDTLNDFVAKYTYDK